MGGFELHDGDTRLRTLDIVELETLEREGKIDWPSISQNQIDDKSKADFLTKTFVVVQAMWFVVGCIGRAANEITVTELEIVTLAFSVLNAVVYWLWWDKPMDVRCPIPVYLKSSPKTLECFGKDNGMSSSFPHDLQWTQQPALMRTSSPSGAQTNGEPKGTSAHFLQSTDATSTSTDDIYDNLWPFTSRQIAKRGVPGGLFYVFIYYPISVLLQPFDDMFNLTNFRGMEDRVPTFYAPALQSSSDSVVLLLALTIIPIFGGIHCLAWRGHFPSVYERWLWRSNSLAICVMPFSMILIGTFIHDDKPDRSIWQKCVDQACEVVLIAQIILYIFSRMCLLVLPLIALRNLPPSAYIALNWIFFIPHVS